MQQGSEFQALQKAHQLYKSGQVVEAIDILKHLIETKPEVYQAWVLLSKYLFQVGYYEEAFLVSDRSEEFDPLMADFAHIQQAVQQNAFAEVEKIALAMLEKQPGHPKALFSLAHIASLTPTSEQAIKILTAGLDYNPANVSLRQMLIETYDNNGQYQKAIDECKYFTEVNTSFDAHWFYVSLLHKHGQYEDVLIASQKARELVKDNKLILSQIDLIRGEAKRILGDRKASESLLRKSLENNNENAGAWWALADLKNYQFTDSDRENLTTITNNAQLDERSKSLATFALAKAAEQSEIPDEIMALYQQANNLHQTPYDPAMVENDFNNLIAAYSAESLLTQSNAEDQSKIPVFIVGLPRSGSTLVEQILASHSKVEGTVEQPTIASVEKQARSLCFKNHKQLLNDCLDKITPEELAELGAAYIDNGALYREFETEFFTDKNPFNFRNVGLIHKILPQAKIIDVRRNPLDCGFSLYKQYFSSGVDFSYDLAHIGEFYNAYLRLMNHWNETLPDRVYTLQYEDLIAEPEQQVTALLAHLGLEFEPGCLEFYQTDRPIRTASSEQVREPINSKGVGAWRAYEQHLQPLKDALGEQTLAEFKQYL